MNEERETEREREREREKRKENRERLGCREKKGKSGGESRAE